MRMWIACYQWYFQVPCRCSLVPILWNYDDTGYQNDILVEKVCTLISTCLRSRLWGYCFQWYNKKKLLKKNEENANRFRVCATRRWRDADVQNCNTIFETCLVHCVSALFWFCILRCLVSALQFWTCHFDSLPGQVAFIVLGLTDAVACERLEENYNCLALQVYNVLPSVSAAIGHYEPQRDIWRAAIATQAMIRALILTMYYHYYRETVYAWAQGISNCALLVYTIENVALVTLSFWSSNENYGSYLKFLCTIIILRVSNVVKSHEKYEGGNTIRWVKISEFLLFLGSF